MSARVTGRARPVARSRFDARGCARLSTSWLNLASVRRARNRYSFTRSRTYRFSLTGAWRPRFCVALRPPALMSIPIFYLRAGSTQGFSSGVVQSALKGGHARGLIARCTCGSHCAAPPLPVPNQAAYPFTALLAQRQATRAIAQTVRQRGWAVQGVSNRFFQRTDQISTHPGPTWCTQQEQACKHALGIRLTVAKVPPRTYVKRPKQPCSLSPNPNQVRTEA